MEGQVFTFVQVANAGLDLTGRHAVISGNIGSGRETGASNCWLS